MDGAKAACGAAERIALYCPLWAILTVVRAGEEKFIENVAFSVHGPQKKQMNAANFI